MTAVHDIKTRLTAGAPVASPLARRILLIILLTMGTLGLAAGAFAQGTVTGAAPRATASGAAPAQEPEDDDRILDPAEPDYVTVNLPTTARLPVGRGTFRISHRFAGDLANGTFSELASSLFGIDQGAIIGFEYRMGVSRGLQAVIFRSNFDRTVQFHAKYDAIRQRGSSPIAISAILSSEGANNFQEQYAPAVGAVISRTIAGRVAVYATPVWVDNTAASLGTAHDHGQATEITPGEHVHRRTTYLGLAARIRVLARVYLTGEIAPRIGGYAPNIPAYGFGLEKRVGRHTFSLTFTNSFAMTYAQLARGGQANSLHLGFNISRKFF